MNDVRHHASVIMSLLLREWHSLFVAFTRRNEVYHSVLSGLMLDFLLGLWQMAAAKQQIGTFIRWFSVSNYYSSSLQLFRSVLLPGWCNVMMHPYVKIWKVWSDQNKLFYAICKSFITFLLHHVVPGRMLIFPSYFSTPISVPWFYPLYILYILLYCL